MEHICRFELLGGLVLRRGGESILHVGTHKDAALLAYLAYRPGHPQSRELLVDLLWPESPPEQGRRSLRVSLTALRKVVEPLGTPRASVLVATHQTVMLQAAAVTTDVAEFEAALRAAARSGRDDDRAAHLTAAVELYRGELLPGFYEDWVLTEQRRLESLYFRAAQRLAAQFRDAGDHDHALECLHRALAVDPLREEIHCGIMRLHAEAGQAPAVLVQFQEMERTLRMKLGAAPSAEAQALLKQLVPGCGRSRAPSLQGHQPGARAAAQNGGVAKGASHLSRRATRFFGREGDIARLVELLTPAGEGEAGALVSLLGPGGIGKTRLALEAASRLSAPYADAVWFVPLGDVADLSGMTRALADAVGLPEEHGAETEDRLVERLSLRPSLLVLDAVEGLLPDGAGLTARLLDRTAGLRCLVTSRQTFGLERECQYHVGPLPVPVEPQVGAPERVALNDSVRLFVDRARLVGSGFALTPENTEAVAALCRRLEGIPLAVELAAARAQVLTPRQILSRLGRRFDLLITSRHDVPKRHRSLRAALEWSVRLLTPYVQRFFACLSVFRGGWTVEAAEAVCDDALAVDHLEYLRACSLVTAEEVGGEMRFGMLDTIRELAAELLPADEQAGTSRRHAGFFLALATEAGAGLISGDQALWMERLRQEHANLSAAIERSLDEGRAEMALRMVVPLRAHWWNRGHATAARAWLARGLAHGADLPPRVRAGSLVADATLAWHQGDLAHARLAHESALSVFRETGDARAIASVLNNLGLVASSQGQRAASVGYLREALQIWPSTGDRHGEANSLNNLGLTLSAQGDYREAEAVHHKALSVRRQIGDRMGVATSLENLAVVLEAQGQYERALVAAEEALATNRAVHNIQAVASCLLVLASVTRDQGDRARTQALVRESLETSQRVCNQFSTANALLRLAEVEAGAGDHVAANRLANEAFVLFDAMGAGLFAGSALVSAAQALAAVGERHQATLLFADGLGRVLQDGSPYVAAETLESYAAFLADTDDLPSAAMLRGAADALRESACVPRPPSAEPEHGGLGRRLADRLGPCALASALERGRALGWEGAMRWAIADAAGR